MRAFCLSVHYISPRAYKFLRKKFGNNMPHPETIRQWYRNSDLDASPGIGKKALAALETRANEMLEKGEQLIVSLIFDEMAIQRSMVWSRSTNKFIGLVDIRDEDDEEEFILANNVIIFMACGINSYFQQPVAFYFIRTLKAYHRAKLLLEIIGEISRVSIISMMNSILCMLSLFYS